METFVLIAGAWHGGWSRRPVATRLRAAGHRVLTPTLPGLDLDDDPRGVTLTDCVDAVVDLVEREDLTDVTLLGHSRGGYVVSLPFEVWAGAFRQDASEDAQRAVFGLLAPQPMTFTEAPNQKPFFELDAPSACVPSVDDVALPPGEYGWTRFPQRLGGTPIEAPGSHEANFARPAELADAFLRAVSA